MIKIRVRGVIGTLHKIDKSTNWQLYFRHPVQRKRQRISLGTPDSEIAKTKAKAILSEALNKDLATLKTHARRETASRVGKAIDHYLAVTHCHSKNVNGNCLLRVLRVAKELIAKDEARDLPLSVLTESLVGDYHSLPSYWFAIKLPFSNVSNQSDSYWRQPIDGEAVYLLGVAYGPSMARPSPYIFLGSARESRPVPWMR